MQGGQQIRGGDQLGLRAYNKRMILNLIRQSGALPKAEIARLTGLSAQAVSVIVNTLLKEKLVRKEKKVRGKVGQPHTPIALNAEGVLSLGVKIGRRSLELMLVDFHGKTLSYKQFPYAAPRQKAVADLLRHELTGILGAIDGALRERIIGVGVAMPGQLSAWTDVMGLDPSELADWDQVDMTSFIADLSSSASASRRFSRAFSCSSSRRRLASETSMPPNFDFQRYSVFSAMPYSRAKSTMVRPASCCFRIEMICSSV